MLLALQLNHLLSHLLHLNTVKTSLYFCTKLITSTTLTLQSNDTEIEEEKGRRNRRTGEQEGNRRTGGEQENRGGAEENRRETGEQEGSRRTGGEHKNRRGAGTAGEQKRRGEK